MSDDLQIDQFGKASVEAGQGYAPMPPAPREIEQAQQEKTAFDAGVERLSAIDQAGESQPLPVHYHEAGDPNKTSDPRLTLEPERAAKDLADWRRGQEEIQRTLRDIELNDEVERLRAESAQPQQQQPPQEPVALDQQQPQPEPPLLPPELQSPENDEIVRAFQREPKLLEAVNTLSWQTDQKIQAAQQQAKQVVENVADVYARELDANARAAIATVFAAYPELQGLSQAELPAAIQVISKQDPNRALQLKNHIQSVQLLSAKAQEAQTQAQQRQQWQAAQQFQSWAQQQDNAFEAATRMDPPQRQTAIRNEAHRMLRETERRH